MTPSELSDLRAKAEAATKGPWFAQNASPESLTRYVCTEAQTRHESAYICKFVWWSRQADECCPRKEQTVANADYIAATNPKTMLRLLDEIDRLNATAETNIDLAATYHERLERQDVVLKMAAEALAFYENRDIYKPHPHGPAFDDRDISYRACAAIAEIRKIMGE